MPKLSLWRKLKLYIQYRKAINKNITDLEQKGFRIDRVKRIYTVINVPPEMFDDAYDLKKTDIDRVSQSFLTDSIRTISKILNGIGINELYKIYETRKVDKYSYLLILGYSLFDTKKIADFIFLRLIPFVLISLAIFYLSLFF